MKKINIAESKIQMAIIKIEVEQAERVHTELEIIDKLQSAHKNQIKKIKKDILRSSSCLSIEEWYKEAKKIVVEQELMEYQLNGDLPDMVKMRRRKNLFRNLIENQIGVDVENFYKKQPTRAKSAYAGSRSRTNRPRYSSQQSRRNINEDSPIRNLNRSGTSSIFA